MGTQLRASGPDIRPPAPVRTPGDVVGAYRLIALLGEGGMGQVFLAEHIQLGRHVALKMLRREHVTDPEAVRRFFCEARAISCIAHPHIVSVTDFVADPAGDSFFIMELIDGVTLGDYLDAVP